MTKDKNKVSWAKCCRVEEEFDRGAWVCIHISFDALAAAAARRLPSLLRHWTHRILETGGAPSVRRLGVRQYQNQRGKRLAT